MKTTTLSRLLGFSGYNLHTLFFFRQASWWTPLLEWLAWLTLGLVILGLVLGIWRFNFVPRQKKSGELYRSPYKSWYQWHHWAGLVFGIMALSWVSSGLVSLGVISGITETLYTPRQIEAGARSVQGQGAHLDFSPLTALDVRQAGTRLSQEFDIAELELLFVNGQYYYLAYRKPTREEMLGWDSRSAFDFITPTLEWEHALVSATDFETGPFRRFEEDRLMAMARRAMPNAAILEDQWLEKPDSYYYRTLDSFDLGLPRSVRSLPVLRVKFDDPSSTWLYLEPSLGQMTKAEIRDRRNRWGYYGLHGLDFGLLFTRRPLWDVVILLLVSGVVVLGASIVVPASRRLMRHSRKKACQASPVNTYPDL